MGAEWNTDPQNYLDNSYIGYEAEPVEDPEADWRLDVFAGSARLPSLINEYLSGVSDVVDALDEDGAAAGFFCYPLGGFSGEDRAAKILDFRDGLEAAVMDAAGEDAVTFLGGASGLYCGYLDFIAWDLDSVLTAASEFLERAAWNGPIFILSAGMWAQLSFWTRKTGKIETVRRRRPDRCCPGKTSTRCSLLTKAAAVIFTRWSIIWKRLSKTE